MELTPLLASEFAKALEIAMPPPYQLPHWTDFSGKPYVPQPSLGEAPSTWARRLGIHHQVPHASGLPGNQLDRGRVMAICQDPAIDELHGYVCAMAWGGQHRVPGGKGSTNVKDAWSQRKALSGILGNLRSGNLSREAAYRLFLDEKGRNKISGLGPSFFTKLIYFFSRDVPAGQEPYIVDNGVLHRMTLLTGLPFFKKASCGGYQACCWEIDQMMQLLVWPFPSPTGSMVEERLFAWELDAEPPRMNYRKAVMFDAYYRVGIPQADF
ncbi:MAG TPA: hypothetical protein VGE67_11710 [Haloferula sp.]